MPTFTPIEEMSYSESVAELDNIIRKMQGDNCDIDLLTTYTRRAAELLRACRAKLVATDAELSKILEELS